MTGRKLPRKSQQAEDDDSKRFTRVTPAFVEGQGRVQPTHVLSHAQESVQTHRDTTELVSVPLVKLNKTSSYRAT